MLNRLISSPRRRLRGMPGWQIAALEQGGWAVFSAVAQQLMRLAANIALAWMLAPEVLGLMVVINTLRTAGELLTDLGIGQGIVQHPDGARPEFYNTAWTLQILRGLFLFAVGLAIAVPVASYYQTPDFAHLIPLAASIFLITGFNAPSLALLQKDMQVKKIAILEFCVTATSIICNLVLVYFIPSVYGLILGLIASSIIIGLATFFFIPHLNMKIVFCKDYAFQIVKFGKWIFLSSMIFFASSNFDRLYFAKEIPLAMLGVYGIARTYAEAALQLVQRAAHLIIFPKISASPRRGQELLSAIAQPRGLLLAAMALALAAAIVLSDAVIGLLYDARYHEAAVMMPILLVGTWFSFLAVLSESIALGIGKPSIVALGNSAKLAWVVITVPLALASEGLLWALAAFAAGDAVRYLTLAVLKRREQISMLRQDILCTSGFAGVTVILLQAASLAGFSTEFGTWLGLAK